METLLSERTTVVAATDQVSCPLGDDIIILSLKAGMYFSLDNVGARLWQLIQQPRTVGEIQEALLQEFDVAPDVCERDVLTLLTDLAERELVEIKDAPAV